MQLIREMFNNSTSFLITENLNLSIVILNVSQYVNSSQVEETNVNKSKSTILIQVLMYVMYLVIWLAAMGGNGIVIYIVLAYQRMQTITNLFIVNLAIGDILMAALCIPFTFVSNLLLQYWPFGSVMCVIVCYSQAVSVFVSAYTLVAISVDRYIAILYPLRPRMSKLHAKLIILVIWIVSLLTPVLTLLKSRLVQQPNSSHFTCMEDWEDNLKRYYYSMTLMVLQYAFPLTVLIYTYTRIAIIVWGKETPGEAQDARDARMAANKRKMIKMMIVCVIAYGFCWMPLNTINIIGDQKPEIWRYKHIVLIWITSHWLAMSHCSYNPIIYFTMNYKFRSALRHLLSCVPCLPLTPTQLNSFNANTNHLTLTALQHNRHKKMNRLKALSMQKNIFHMSDIHLNNHNIGDSF